MLSQYYIYSILSLPKKKQQILAYNLPILFIDNIVCIVLENQRLLAADSFVLYHFKEQ